MTAPDAIHELVKKFEQHRKEYQSHKNETELRREFLDPFFKALGWDVFNEKSYSERFKEVAHEVSVEVEGQAKAADYAFRVGDKTIFFVEAKKPSVNIGANPGPAFQLRRYGWSAKLPVNILTDFEQLAVYDCHNMPKKTDKASFGRINLYHYSEYIEKWDEIAAVFSHEAVLQGAFDKFVEGKAGKKGTEQVDAAFLKEIERWRELLARNIALRNADISNEREMNFAVQMLIDRIIFLRIGEDRGIEPDLQLQQIGAGAEVYTELLALFRRADTRHNSGLFHFSAEKDQSSHPDTLTPKLKVDDRVLKDIIQNLYYPDSPYVFTYLSADILGQVYEQFLGKVIRLTAGHQAKVEEKPEVRKAGGVYYTPTYIVDYIVKNTVGKLLAGKTPKQAASLKVLDPACGSGSFLLGAYQYLLDWHVNWYAENEPEKWAKGSEPKIYQALGGDWRLTTAEKKRILLDNIHGVDIDAQAVEVTKLSLLLKVLEGESGQMRLGFERALPDLGHNIQCGNSLIGPDYYEGQQLSMLIDTEEQYRVNAFDWQKAFPQVFTAGGFDAVIGNPPYIRIQAMKEWAPTEVEFYKIRYKAASKGNYDIYVVFVEKGLSLLNRNGKLGFILPHKFFNAQYGEPLRLIISKGNHITSIVHFGSQQIFQGATTYTCLLFLDKVGKKEFSFEKIEDIDEWILTHNGISGQIPSEIAESGEWNFVVGKGTELFRQLSTITTKLGDVADIFVGLQTSADDVFIMNLIEEDLKTFRLFSKAMDSDYTFEKELLFPIISGTDVNRYQKLPERQYVLFPYSTSNSNVALIDFDTINNKYPKISEYLLKNKKRLEDREKGKMKCSRWYGYIYLKNMTRQKTKKLCVPRLVDRLYATYDDEAIHFLDNVDVGGVVYKKEYEQQGLIYLLGLLNSRLLRWYFPYVSAPFRGGWLSANKQFLSQIPIFVINFSNPTEKAQHDKMVALVERMLALHKQSGSTPQEQEMIARQIESTDAAIDRLVYELYGLTEEEIKIVEGVPD